MKSQRCGIYKITNCINNMIYIGQSNDIDRRWQEHKRPSKIINPTNKLYLAFKEFGIENFSFEVIEECDLTQLNEREQYWIEYYDSYEKGYNMSKIENLQKKMNISQVKEIQERLINSDVSNQDLARQYGVSHTWISLVNQGKMWYDESLSYPLRPIQQHEKKIKEPVKRRKVERPNRNDLKDMIRNQTFVSIGAYYGVSDNAIRKWCSSYNLPTSKRKINAYSEEDWALI